MTARARTGSAAPAAPAAPPESSWDANAERWTRAVREDRIASRRAGTDAAVLDRLETRLRDKPAARLLDAGCGEGWSIRALRARLSGLAATGTDASAALVAAACAADPDGDYRALDYAALAGDPALLPGPFDAVLFNFALFDADLGPPLAAARRRLAPGGAVVIQTLAPAAIDGPEGWRTEDFAAFGEPGWRPMRWYFRREEGWRAAVEAAGLSLDTAETVTAPDGAPLSLLMTASCS